MAENTRNIGAISLEQIVRFAGAVQDFNPIHYDESFAKAAGLPGVVAHGPLTYLIALDALIAAQGRSKIGGFQARLKAPVRPGARLSIAWNADGNVTMKADDTEALVGTVTAARSAS
jgi:acyl dehydratase